MIEIKGKYTTARVYVEHLEEAASQQIGTIVNHPVFTNPVVVMPDVHAGMGSVIGFTMPLGKRVIPNIVGVDIGCGMLAIKLKRPANLKPDRLDREIRTLIPFGTDVRDGSNQQGLRERDPFFERLEGKLVEMWQGMQKRFGNEAIKFPEIDYRWYQKKCDMVGIDFSRVQRSIGSLGGGNHFIEFGIPSNDSSALWIVVHSGSRQLGKKICEFHQNRARKEQKQATGRKFQAAVEKIKRECHDDLVNQKILQLRAELGIASGVNNRGLESLAGEKMYQYLYDMAFTQLYASYNRVLMMRDILTILLPNLKIGRSPLESLSDRSILDRVETIHNFISTRDLIIRKGAVESHSNQKIVIPFNMKDGTWICRGKGESGWNFSAPHGAGRRMSRSKAKQVLNLKDAEKQMKGIFTSCIPLDEVPAAYKPADEIQHALSSTAELIEEIKPILNLKAK